MLTKHDIKVPNEEKPSVWTHFIALFGVPSGMMRGGIYYDPKAHKQYLDRERRTKKKEFLQ